MHRRTMTSNVDRAKVADANLNDVGSISLDAELAAE